MTTGRVEAIHVAPEAGAPMEPRDRVRTHAGRGLDGDRYTTGTGHWSAIRRSGDGLTIVAAEAIDAVNAEHGLGLAPGDTRRNVTVRGVDLDALIGREFAIGAVRVRGVRRCEPCQYLEGLLDKPVLVPLVHRGGLRVEILTDGEIAVGDPIEPIDLPAGTPSAPSGFPPPALG